jgi:ribonuclease VapC
MTAVVFDASAVLAWLRREPGSDVVDPLLATAVISAVNWSETWQKLDQHGADADKATGRLRALGLRIEPVTEADAVQAARLWPLTRKAGLSLGDRCCLALGARLGLTTVTADAAWADLPVDVEIQLIR